LTINDMGSMKDLSLSITKKRIAAAVASHSEFDQSH